MRRLLLPFFVFHLWLVQLPFFLTYSSTVLYPIRSFFLTLILFSYFIYLLSVPFPATPPPKETDSATSAVLTETIKTWEEYHRLQPTHRDVLLNLSLLYSAQGEQEKARKYLLQAQAVDPNNEIVKSFTTR